MSTTESRFPYGLDAPGVVRNLLLAGGLGALLFLTAAVGLWSGVIGFVDVAGTGAGVAIGCISMGLYMLWAGTRGKFRERDRILGLVDWTRCRSALDVGCGRGLLLVGAAKRMPDGKARGVDLWQSEDLSANRPDAPLENARREGVGERVEVETADMRKLPFPGATFDAIVTRAAIHNIYDAKGREEAVREIVRVLAPRGQLVLDDIRHGDEYARALAAAGVDVKRVDSRAASTFFTLVTFGGLRPVTLVGHKR